MRSIFAMIVYWWDLFISQEKFIYCFEISSRPFWLWMVLIPILHESWQRCSISMPAISYTLLIIMSQALMTKASPLWHKIMNVCVCVRAFLIIDFSKWYLPTCTNRAVRGLICKQGRAVGQLYQTNWYLSKTNNEIPGLRKSLHTWEHFLSVSDTIRKMWQAFC